MSAIPIRIASIRSQIIETSRTLVESKGLETLIVGDHPDEYG
ncbi:hypothetical protein R3Q06_27500 [Rhodococcus erythropolis]|nr:hypothetical protein [Rhodococcus erythropolis]MDV6277246.1 hypothetical protein [Rhodococcus erythropolis]